MHHTLYFSTFLLLTERFEIWELKKIPRFEFDNIVLGSLFSIANSLRNRSYH